MEIVPADDNRAIGQFIDFPYRHYRNDPYWIAPLRLAQKDLLDTAKHPFYRHAEMCCFLARQDGKIVGRVAAILDKNQFEPDASGFFGFFESVDSQPVANALLSAARGWLWARGARVMRGPVSPSTNYECGLLVEGFDSSPFVMMTHNPPYYATLLEKAGLRKSKDLYAYLTLAMNVNGEKAARVAERVRRTRGVHIRPIRMKEFSAEVDSIWRIYSSAWSQNWGFAPMTKEEFQVMAKDMKSILDPGLALIGEVNDQPVGFALALPDINQALKHAGGRLFPLGLVKILYYQRLIRTLRVLALGVVDEYRTAGVAAAFYAALITYAQQKGYGNCEFSWVLEDNILMNRSIAALG
ncbi:MAG: N-acetyltransferase, partial [Bryobacteraceae bacterium]